MTVEELRARIASGLNASRPFGELREVIETYAKEGGGQEEARLRLQSMRSDFDDATEDRILELLDLVTGFVCRELRIWPD